MKSERLIHILLDLQANGKTSASKLAKRLEVSPRTIHRDLESLAAAGVPVYAERGRDGGWLLSEGYRTNLTGMKVDELRALLLVHASGVIDELGMTSSIESALIKLLASVPPPFRSEVEATRERVYIDDDAPDRFQKQTPLVPLLLRAAETHETIIIEYDKRGTVTKRNVDPLGLVARGGTWYLMTREGKNFRTFRVTNLRSATLTGAKFKRPDRFDLRSHTRSWWESYRKQIPKYIVELDVNERQMRRIRWFPYLSLLRESAPSETGRCRVKIDFETEEWATRMVLWMGSDAKVIAPVELKENVRREALAIANG